MDIARQYLARDPVYYVNMLTHLEAPTTRILYAAADGLLLESDWLCCVSAAGDEAVQRILPLLSTPDLLVFEPILYAPVEALAYRRGMLCYPCRYTKEEPIPIKLPPGIAIEPLGHEYDDFVASHYTHAEGNAEYLRSRIDDGMFGLFERGAVAGFIGIHGGGEMGLLEILPAYRRKGYAALLEAWMINHRLSLGRIPHGEVETWNAASLALQKRLGMTVSEKTCAWYERADPR